jgi:hypothetical protein
MSVYKLHYLLNSRLQNIQISLSISHVRFALIHNCFAPDNSILPCDPHAERIRGREPQMAWHQDELIGVNRQS